MPAFPRAAPAALLTALLLTGCTSFASVAPASSVRTDGELTRVAASVDLEDAVGTDVRIDDVTTTPSGNPVLLLGSLNDATTSYLLTLRGDGSETRSVRRLPGVRQGRLFADRVGGVLVAGLAAGAPRFGYRLLSLARGASRATVLPLTPEPGPPPPDMSTAALSLDGRTLFAAFSWDDGQPSLLAAVDVRTGTVLGIAPVLPAGSGMERVSALAIAPDGGVLALVEVNRAAGTRSLLVRYDARLRATAAPVDLLPDTTESQPVSLAVADDGTAVATVIAGYFASGDVRFVVVDDGRVVGTRRLPTFDRIPPEFAVDASGRRVYLPYARFPYGTWLATIDLVSGRQVGLVSLCPAAGFFSDVALARGGRSMTVTGVCLTGRGARATALVVR